MLWRFRVEDGSNVFEFDFEGTAEEAGAEQKRLTYDVFFKQVQRAAAKGVYGTVTLRPITDG